MGALGVLVPLVSSADEARAVVDATTIPARGVAQLRAAASQPIHLRQRRLSRAGQREHARGAHSRDERRTRRAGGDRRGSRRRRADARPVRHVARPGAGPAQAAAPGDRRGDEAHDRGRAAATASQSARHPPRWGEYRSCWTPASPSSAAARTTACWPPRPGRTSRRPAASRRLRGGWRASESPGTGSWLQQNCSGIPVSPKLPSPIIEDCVDKAWLIGPFCRREFAKRRSRVPGHSRIQNVR